VRSGYTVVMQVATRASVKVGVRELKNNLSAYLDEVADGATIVVTERGKPVARIVGIDQPTSHLAELIAAGVVQPPTSRVRHRPAKLIEAIGTVSDLVAEQRR
jgi:prevent-host-death family protein